MLFFFNYLYIDVKIESINNPRNQIGVELILKKGKEKSKLQFAHLSDFLYLNTQKKMFSQQHRQDKCDNKSHILFHTKANDGHVCQTER